VTLVASSWGTKGGYSFWRRGSRRDPTPSRFTQVEFTPSVSLFSPPLFTAETWSFLTFTFIIHIKVVKVQLLFVKIGGTFGIPSIMIQWISDEVELLIKNWHQRSKSYKCSVMSCLCWDLACHLNKGTRGQYQETFFHQPPFPSIWKWKNRGYRDFYIKFFLVVSPSIIQSHQFKAYKQYVRGRQVHFKDSGCLF